MSKIIRMPKRAGQGKAESGASNGHSEHVVRYPRIQRGNHYADFSRDGRVHPEVYHCLIQREGSSQIISWTQHSTLEAAVGAAEVELSLILGSIAIEA